ncbi:MAG TPA: sulfotransferase domain-containing protein [Chthoniobacterales bacterium]|nr:sulfotransferase domain-containing protein [Chthoniobacterales bacterium]
MLANGFYKRLDDVPESELELVCYGIPRSGSTLVYQLISGIYPEGIAKTHRYCPYRVKTTVSFRDFRDVVVSLWRRSNPTKVDRGMTEEDIEKFTATCRQRIEELDRYFERGGICPLRYEDFAPNPALVFSALERRFGIIVAPEKAAGLIAQYSIEKNAAIAQKLGNFKSIDPASQIHGNHIFRGEIGGWRQFVTGDAAKRLEKLLEEPLRRYGYEVSPQ